MKVKEDSEKAGLKLKIQKRHRKSRHKDGKGGQRSKRLLISWLQSPSAVILEPKKIKSATVSTVSSSISHEMMGPNWERGV